MLRLQVLSRREQSPSVVWLSGEDQHARADGVDALGAVADEETVPGVEVQAGDALEHWDADLFGGAEVDGGFVDDRVARLERAPTVSLARTSGV